jgi:surface protein
MMQQTPRYNVSHGGAARFESLLCRWALASRSHRLAGLALLLFLPAHVAALTAITDANDGTAATLWMTNPAAAATTYGNIGDWNTAGVTDTYQLFQSMTTFNADISKWNTASVGSDAYFGFGYVTTMAYMFEGATAFNQNIGSWNTARSKGMWNMFSGATAFNQNVASWNTASVSNMASVRQLLFPTAFMCSAWAMR